MGTKKKLTEVKVWILLKRLPTMEELNNLRKVFPNTPIHFSEKWERDTQVQDGKDTSRK